MENPGKPTKKRSHRKARKVQGICGVSRRMLAEDASSAKLRDFQRNSER
jgi:hypothetical protein